MIKIGTETQQRPSVSYLFHLFEKCFKDDIQNCYTTPLVENYLSLCPSHLQRLQDNSFLKNQKTYLHFQKILKYLNSY